MDKTKYQKFGQRIGSLASYYSIWLAEDHLLLCEDVQFLERYKRFYFKDIQALIIRKTSNSFIVSLVAFTLALIFLFFLVHAKKGWNIFWGILVGFNALILVINIIKGQSCVTYLQTAVQKEEFKSLNRIKKFNKFLAKIKPIIFTIQGDIDPQALAIKYQTSFDEREVKTALDFQPILQGSLIHTLLASFLLIWSLMVGAVYLLPNPVLYFLILILYSVISVLNIMAVVRQYKMNLQSNLKNWAWGSLVFMGVCLIFTYTLFFIVTMQVAKTHLNPNEYSAFDMIKRIPDNSFVNTILLIVFYSSILLGIVGLFLSAKPRSENKS